MLEQLNRHKCWDGVTAFYRHASMTNRCDMRFAVFVPETAAGSAVPMLTYLSGLTCTEETFTIKAGAQRVAAELGMMLVVPDTSPRGEGVPDDPDGAYDFGRGAGFYVDATQEPWSRHYQMYSYITQELRSLVIENFPADPARLGIFGHSMGGHGALTIGLRNPGIYRSISAFSPIAAPSQCPWGTKALGGYLGADRAAWAEYDATEIMRRSVDATDASPILIDQGLADDFLAEQLHPDLFEAACAEVGYPLELRRHEGYDHGYYFIQTFVEDHLRHHARILAT